VTIPHRGPGLLGLALDAITATLNTIWKARPMTSKITLVDPVACPFCARINRNEYIDRYGNVVRFEPLNPVVPGHMLFVPARHATSAAIDPDGAAQAMEFAAAYVRDIYAHHTAANIITSIGPAATQTVWHTHIHVIPRREGDGLTLPWPSQHDRTDTE
jgi:diadenosine tetraphosphate (Ap4A) HIT family hydrolase